MAKKRRLSRIARGKDTSMPYYITPLHSKVKLGSRITIKIVSRSQNKYFLIYQHPKPKPSSKFSVFSCVWELKNHILSRFILTKSTKLSFSCHRELNIHFMISKCIALNWAHQKKQKTYTYFVKKMQRSSSRAQKSSSMNCSKILFLEARSLVKRLTSLQKRISE